MTRPDGHSDPQQQMFYMKLAEEGLLRQILDDSYNATRDLYKPGTRLKARPQPKRTLSRLEYYLSKCGYCSSNVISYIQKIEHIGLFIEDGTLPKKYKENDICSHEVLLYNIENFIIRTQGLQERLLCLIDAVLNLGNDSENISFNLIKNNSHVNFLSLDDDLTKIKKISKKYQYDRNGIVHERNYLDDEIGMLQLYSLLSRHCLYQGDKEMSLEYNMEAKSNERQLRSKWKRNVIKFLEDIEPSVENILMKMQATYNGNKSMMDNSGRTV